MLMSTFFFFGQRSLATDLQNLSMELRKKQSTYLKRLRQQKEVREEFPYRGAIEPLALYIILFYFIKQTDSFIAVILYHSFLS